MNWKLQIINKDLEAAHPQSGSLSTFPDQVGIWKCCFLWSGENRSTLRKTPQGKGENQRQIQPTYVIDTEGKFWAGGGGGGIIITEEL